MEYLDFVVNYLMASIVRLFEPMLSMDGLQEELRMAQARRFDFLSKVDSFWGKRFNSRSLGGNKPKGTGVRIRQNLQHLFDLGFQVPPLTFSELRAEALGNNFSVD